MRRWCAIRSFAVGRFTERELTVLPFGCRILGGGASRDFLLHPVRSESSYSQRNRAVEQLDSGILPYSSRTVSRERLPGYELSLSFRGIDPISCFESL